MFNVVYSENKTVTSETPVKDSYRSKMKIIHALTPRKNKQLTPNTGGEKACMLKICPSTSTELSGCRRHAEVLYGLSSHPGRSGTLDTRTEYRSTAIVVFHKVMAAVNSNWVVVPVGGEVAMGRNRLLGG